MSVRKPDHLDRDGAVVVSVLIAAEPATVWTFLSDGARFAAWVGAFAGGPPLPGTRVDPRVGGELRVVYPPGHVAAFGRITTVETPRRIEFSWGYESGEHGIAAESTRVEITLTPDVEGTLVTLRHTGLPSDEARRGHLAGWKHYLSMLARSAAEDQHAERLPAVLEAYFRAWNEPDEAARLRLLEQCCEPDVRVRTSFACTDGVAELSAHIANGLKHMPGMSLRQDGAVQQMHGRAQVGWAVRSPDGKEVFRGVSFMSLSLRGKLTKLVSFADRVGG